MRRPLTLFVCLAAFLLLAAFEKGDKRVAILVYPHVVVAPPGGQATVRVTAHIPYDEANRKWSIGWAYGFSSGDTHSPAQSSEYPVCTEQNYRPCLREVPLGLYTFEACVYEVSGKKFCDRNEVEVR